MPELVDIDYPDAPLIRVVMDNLSTHLPAAFYDRFPAPEARRILKRLEFHHTPNHAGWLNIVEIEIGVLRSQCLDRRIDNKEIIIAEVAAWDARQGIAAKRAASAGRQGWPQFWRVRADLEFGAMSAPDRCVRARRRTLTRKEFMVIQAYILDASPFATKASQTPNASPPSGNGRGGYSAQMVAVAADCRLCCIATSEAPVCESRSSMKVPPGRR